MEQYLFTCICEREHRSSIAAPPEGWRLENGVATCPDCTHDIREGRMRPPRAAARKEDQITDTKEDCGARGIRKGACLATRDGRRIGNAIILQRAEAPARTFTRDPQPCWVIETDFGNRLTLTETEIGGLFHICPPTDVERWRCDRTFALVASAQADLAARTSAREQMT